MEEAVGKFWHTKISRFSDHKHPDARVYLADIVDKLSLQFRTLGGEPGIQIVPTQKTHWQARPSMLSRFANLGDKTELAWQSESEIRLPSEISEFSKKELNQKLYLWLLVLLSVTGRNQLRTSSCWFQSNQGNTKKAFAAYPGARKLFLRLAEEHLSYRIEKAYIRKEFFEEEALIRRALKTPGEVIGKITEPNLLPPVPLWLHPQQTSDWVSNSRGPTAMSNDHKKNKGVKKLKEKHRKKGEFVEECDGKNGLLGFD